MALRCVIATSFLFVAGACQNLEPVRPMMPINPATGPKLDARPPTMMPAANPDPKPPVDAAAPPDAAVDTMTIADPKPPVDRMPMEAQPNLPPMPKPPGVWWKPTVGMTWDWQVKTPIDPTAPVQVYDIDLFENAATVMADLKTRGKKIICYVNMGSWENWRPDAAKFP